MRSRRTGIYFRVTKQGSLEEGDTVRVTDRHPAGVATSEITRLHVSDRVEADGLRRVLEVATLSRVWAARFRERLDGLNEPRA
jgi:MOSC domain-containing protein YiiM